MIRININYQNNYIKKITLKGHANYADYGNDIVCAAVSATYLCTINGILSINENSVPFGKDGLIKLLDRYHFQSASQILDTILDSLRFYVGDEPIKDDITMIIMKRRKES